MESFRKLSEVKPPEDLAANIMHAVLDEPATEWEQAEASPTESSKTLLLVAAAVGLAHVILLIAPWTLWQWFVSSYQQITTLIRATLDLGLASLSLFRTFLGIGSKALWVTAKPFGAIGRQMLELVAGSPLWIAFLLGFMIVLSSLVVWLLQKRSVDHV